MVRTNDGDVDLEDATIMDVRRHSGRIEVVLDHVRLCRHGTWRDLRAAVVVMHRVLDERADFFIGDDVTGPHPDPTHPLDVIEVADYHDGVLRLQGYRRREPWFVWTVSTEELSVRSDPPDEVQG